MTGTPSGRQLHMDDGTTRHFVVIGAFLHEPLAMPRGYVGRKSKAKLRSEEHESHMRRSTGGRGHVGVQSPKVIRISGTYMRQIGGAKVTRLTPGDLSVCLPNRTRDKGRATLPKRPGRPVLHATGSETNSV